MNTIRALFFVGVCLLLTAAPAVAQTHATSASSVTFLGTAHLKSGAAPQKPATTFLRKDIEVDKSFDIPGANGNNSPARVKAAHVPTASGNSIVSGSFFGFEGLTEFDQAFLVFAGTNGVNGGRVSGKSIHHLNFPRDLVHFEDCYLHRAHVPAVTQCHKPYL